MSRPAGQRRRRGCCRISVYEEGGKTRLATIKPTALIGLYPNPELKGVAEEVETTLVLIMDEAAR